MADDEEKSSKPLFQMVTPDGMAMLSADLAVIQNLPERGMFHLTFFQSQLPIFQDGEGPADKINAHCVVRLALSPQTVHALIGILQSNFEKFVRVVAPETLSPEGEGK